MPTVKNRQLPLTIPTNLILAFSWEKGIKKKWIGGRAVEVWRNPEKTLQLLGTLAGRSSLYSSMKKAKPRPK